MGTGRLIWGDAGCRERFDKGMNSQSTSVKLERKTSVEKNILTFLKVCPFASLVKLVRIDAKLWLAYDSSRVETGRDKLGCYKNAYFVETAALDEKITFLQNRFILLMSLVEKKKTIQLQLSW